jgi:hypothetical protein
MMFCFASGPNATREDPLPQEDPLSENYATGVGSIHRSPVRLAAIVTLTGTTST